MSKHIARKFFRIKLYDPKFSMLTEDEKIFITNVGKAEVAGETNELILHICFLKALLQVVTLRIKKETV
jgi:hypothetical protein